ncbi:hypothetical protein KEM60_02237 [Austwickia sp. TVS 96-490-7B]|nr:hypothetical protein [Austwickia sp. TVS 96-490-7B]
MSNVERGPPYRVDEALGCITIDEPMRGVSRQSSRVIAGSAYGYQPRDMWPCETHLLIPSYFRKNTAGLHTFPELV